MSITYKKANSNPFCDDEDDWGFGPRGQAGQSSRDPFMDEDVPMTRAERLQLQKEKSMNNQLASTQRALAGIYEAESTGIATAEELVRQGEQLDNIEQKTHAINQDMKQTQKSINGIKSVFGSIKNWWGSKKEEPKEEFKAPAKSSQLRSTVNEQRDMGEHPALRMRSDDYQGFYQEEKDYGAGSGAGSGYGGGYSSQSDRRTSGQTQKSSMAAYDDQMDANLVMMSDGLSRLKSLGLGLETEIDDQNKQLDRIGTGVDRADVTIQDQNRQMKGILGSKKKK